MLSQPVIVSVYCHCLAFSFPVPQTHAVFVGSTLQKCAPKIQILKLQTLQSLTVSLQSLVSLLMFRD